jgi:hypothetical protein
LIAAGVKAYLAARPVYRFKDVVLKSTLRDVAIEGSTVAIAVSVVNLTVTFAVFVVALLGAVALIARLARQPARRQPASA